MTKHKYYFFLLTILMVFGSLNSQSFPDEEFTWESFEECSSNDDSFPVFAKVEKDPVLVSCSILEFESFLRKAVSKCEFGQNQNGLIKMKILFSGDVGVCLRDLGTKKLILEKEDLGLFKGLFDQINGVKLGEQRGIEVVSLGTLYLDVVAGKYSSCRNVNFKFR